MFFIIILYFSPLSVIQKKYEKMLKYYLFA